MRMRVFFLNIIMYAHISIGRSLSIACKKYANTKCAGKSFKHNKYLIYLNHIAKKFEEHFKCLSLLKIILTDDKIDYMARNSKSNITILYQHTTYTTSIIN